MTKKPIGGKTYFASDLHLGADARLSSRDREKLFVRWLDFAAQDADAIYLLGDLFDFWFEYRRVVPKGFVRLLGKLAELRDGGLPIYYFTGNHDLWMFGYFEEELGIPVYRYPIRRQIGEHQFLIGHGDGLGPGDKGFKRLKKVFTNKYSQWLFARLHPNLGIEIADYFSGRSRSLYPESPEFMGPDYEWLVAYCERKILTEPVDYFIFGHRHLPIDYLLSNQKSRYLNLGDWLHNQTYGIYHLGEMQLACFVK